VVHAERDRADHREGNLRFREGRQGLAQRCGQACSAATHEVEVEKLDPRRGHDALTHRRYPRALVLARLAQTIPHIAARPLSDLYGRSLGDGDGGTAW
jgi:hypothetical protein